MAASHAIAAPIIISPKILAELVVTAGKPAPKSLLPPSVMR